MRTIVEPEATAASRSSLIPIERSSNSRSSANRRTLSKDARAAIRPGAATVMRPRTSSPSARSFPTNSPTAAGAQPLRPGKPVVSTWTRTAAPGTQRAIARALGLPGHALPQGDQWGQLGHLVPLHRTEKVPCHGLRLAFPFACRRGLGHQLGCVVLAQIPKSGRPRHRHDGRPEALGDTDDADSFGIAPGVLDALADTVEPLRDRAGGGKVAGRASGGRRGRRNRRHPGRIRSRIPRRRRRCRPAPAYRRWRRSGRPTWKAAHRPPSVRSRRR